jgi:hypothetical protein
MAISISTAPTNDATRREAVTVSPEDTLGETAEKLAAADADSALVLDFGRPIGTLTRRDLMRASAARVHPSEGRVREWMSAYGSAPAQEFVHQELVRRSWPEEPADVEPKLCELQYAAGRVEQCPGESCLYWVDEACILAPLKGDIGANPDLVAFLLSLRNRLGGAVSSIFGLLPGLT